MQIRRFVTLTTLIAAEAGTAIILLHLDSRVRGGGPASFIHGPPEDAVVAVARLVALALAVWLLATTSVYALARAGRIPALLRAVQWATFPPVRRLIDGLLVTTIVAGSTLTVSHTAWATTAWDGPVVAPIGQVDPPAGATGTPVYRPHAAGDPDDTVPAYRPRAAGDPAPDTGIDGSAPPRISSGRADTTAVRGQPRESTPVPMAPTYTVRPGDSLWRIAVLHVASETGRPVSDLGRDEVRAYWTLLVSSNREHLRSRNPNLIFAGEALVLPPRFEQP